MLSEEKEKQKEEEFQEADILWPDAGEKLELPQMYYYDDGDEHSGEHRPTEPHNQQKASSPIDIPRRRKTSWTSGAQGTSRALRMPGATSRFGASHAGAGGNSLMIGSHVFAPPHVIVDRRAKRETAMFMLVDVPNRRRVRAMVIQE